MWSRVFRFAFGYQPFPRPPTIFEMQNEPTKVYTRYSKRYREAGFMDWFQIGLMVVGAGTGYAANRDQTPESKTIGMLCGTLTGAVAGLIPIVTVPTIVTLFLRSEQTVFDRFRVKETHDKETMTVLWKF